MMLNVVDKILAQPEVLTSLMQIRLPSTVLFGSGGLNFDSVAAIMRGGGGSEDHSSPRHEGKTPKTTLLAQSMPLAIAPSVRGELLHGAAFEKMASLMASLSAPAPGDSHARVA